MTNETAMQPMLYVIIVKICKELSDLGPDSRYRLCKRDNLKEGREIAMSCEKKRF